MNPYRVSRKYSKVTQGFRVRNVQVGSTLLTGFHDKSMLEKLTNWRDLGRWDNWLDLLAAEGVFCYSPFRSALHSLLFMCLIFSWAFQIGSCPSRCLPVRKTIHLSIVWVNSMHSIPGVNSEHFNDYGDPSSQNKLFSQSRFDSEN
jgi:hypothetical protein